MQSRNRQRKTKFARQLAVSALALSSTLLGATALADSKHNGHRQDNQHGYADWNRQVWSNHRNQVRVHIPVRDHGPETLPLGRLIRQNSRIDLDRYRLRAVITTNGRFSNGYASLRTGQQKSGRYLLNSHGQTRIPAPSRAKRTWQLRLGPGTQVRSVTAVLEPRHRVVAHQQLWQYRQQSQQRKHGQVRQTRVELARTRAELDASRKQSKKLKHQKERLAGAHH